MGQAVMASGHVRIERRAFSTARLCALPRPCGLPDGPGEEGVVVVPPPEQQDDWPSFQDQLTPH